MSRQPCKSSAISTLIKSLSGAQSDSDKSTGQSLADKAGRSKDEHEHSGSGGSVMDKVKGTLGMDKS